MKDDEDLDDWLAGLAGTRPDRGADDDASRLRRAVLDEDARQRDTGAADQLGLRRLNARLEREGLLEPLKTTPPQATTAPEALRRRGRLPWLVGIAATLVLATVMLRVTAPQGGPDALPIPQEIPRGVAGAVRVPTLEAARDSQRLQAELRALNLAPEVREDGERLLIDVNVDEAALERFTPWFESRGGRVNGPGRYRLILLPPTP